MPVEFHAILIILVSICCTQEIASLSQRRNCIPLGKKCLIEEATSPEGHCNKSLTCSEDHEDSCPPGLFCEGGQCECGVYPNYIVSCNGTASSILQCNCATFNEEKKVVLAGACFYGCKGQSNKNSNVYHPLPRTGKALNDVMCKSFNRTETLCGRCLPDHYPLAYSFNMTCILCPHANRNWWRYVIAAYLPLTLFYIIILFFKINIISSHLFAIVVVSQIATTPAISRVMLSTLNTDSYAGDSYILLVRILLSLHGIWNLDFFRPFYSDICLGIGTLPTLALDYAIAVCPFFLMIITYLLIVLYDRNYRVITIMWRPFRVLFSYYRRNWDVRTSVIDAYATFFLLSFVKFLSVSFDLLVPTRVYELHQHHYNYSLGLFYAADIEYFGSEHLLYGILAVVMSLFFVILPVTTLAFYQFTFFQRFLNLFPVRWYILHTFMDAFQGSYKNGTQPGTRDCRWFSSVYFICYFLVIVQYAFTSSVISIIIEAFILMFISLLIITVQPYKSSLSHLNFINALFIFGLSSLVISIAGQILSTVFDHQCIYFFYILSIMIGCSFYTFIFCYVSYRIFKSRHLCFTLINRMRACKRGYNLLPESHKSGTSSIENPEACIKQNLDNFIN